MKIHCLKCKKEFIPNEFSVRIVGPNVEVTCPFCSYFYDGKFTSFLRDLLGGYDAQSSKDARLMQRLGRYIELNSSEYYKKRGLRHGGKKKVRDV
jgi:hypothetical protein